MKKTDPLITLVVANASDDRSTIKVQRKLHLLLFLQSALVKVSNVLLPSSLDQNFSFKIHLMSTSSISIRSDTCVKLLHIEPCYLQSLLSTLVVKFWACWLYRNASSRECKDGKTYTASLEGCRATTKSTLISRLHFDDYAKLPVEHFT